MPGQDIIRNPRRFGLVPFRVFDVGDPRPGQQPVALIGDQLLEHRERVGGRFRAT